MTKSTTIRFFLALFAIISSLSVFAQNEGQTVLKSRLAVVAQETKTTVWVSDFPKNTSVVLFDEDDNLISIVSTNEFGAAYISLPKSITTTIYAKTMNGEINVSNKAKQSKALEQNVAVQNDPINNSSKA